MFLRLETFVALLGISNVVSQPTGMSTYVSRTFTIFEGTGCVEGVNTKLLPLTLGVDKLQEDMPLSVSGGPAWCLMIECTNETNYNFSYYMQPGCYDASGSEKDGNGWFTMNETNGIRLGDGECAEAFAYDGADVSFQVWGFDEVLQCGDVDFAPSTRYSALVAVFAALLCFLGTW